MIAFSYIVALGLFAQARAAAQVCTGPFLHSLQESSLFEFVAAPVTVTAAQLLAISPAIPADAAACKVSHTL